GVLADRLDAAGGEVDARARLQGAVYQVVAGEGGGVAAGEEEDAAAVGAGDQRAAGELERLLEGDLLAVEPVGEHEVGVVLAAARAGDLRGEGVELGGAGEVAEVDLLVAGVAAGGEAEGGEGERCENAGDVAH